MADVFQTDVGEVNKNLILFLHCLGMRMYQRKKANSFSSSSPAHTTISVEQLQTTFGYKNPFVIADRYSLAILIH